MDRLQSLGLGPAARANRWPVTSLHTLQGIRLMAHWNLRQDNTLLWGLSCTGEIRSSGLAACLAHKWDEHTLAILAFGQTINPGVRHATGTQE